MLAEEIFDSPFYGLWPKELRVGPPRLLNENSHTSNNTGDSYRCARNTTQCRASRPDLLSLWLRAVAEYHRAMLMERLVLRGKVELDLRDGLARVQVLPGSAGGRRRDRSRGCAGGCAGAGAGVAVAAWRTFGQVLLQFMMV